MSKKYDIPAKPTYYRGRLFRSRLEARFAAYFENWPGATVEYEPFDLEGWSPDFLIQVKQITFLVEVKPSSEYFDIRKYINVDFSKYAVMLASPKEFITLSDVMIESIQIGNDPAWIEAGNKVMFLKPEL
jgi:hypothetical protein